MTSDENDERLGAVYEHIPLRTSQKVNQEETDKLTLVNLSKRKKMILIFCTLANFLSGSAFALLAPFFPQEAQSKGMSLTTVGVVLSVYQLIVFLTSPIIGNYITRIGVKFVFLSGIFVAGSCIILFGALDQCPDGVPFTVMCLVCRCEEALGFAAYTTATLTIVSTEYPDHVGSVFATLEGGWAFGMLFGPVVGGALYDWGGFGLPFYLNGCLILLNGFVIYLLLSDLENVPETRKMSIFRLIRNPLAIIPMLSAFIGIACITLLDSTFATHMEPFGLSAATIGALYVIGPGIYAILAPLYGYLTDIKDIQAPLVIVGHGILAIGIFMVGPSPWFPFIPFEVWTTGVGFVLMGAALGAVYIPSIKSILIAAHILEYEKGMDTNAMVSGIVNSCLAFGGFVGPLAGAAAMDQWGAQTAYTIFGVVSLCVMVLAAVFYAYRYRKRNGVDQLDIEQEKFPVCNE